jgi:hypothetical protein
MGRMTSRLDLANFPLPYLFLPPKHLLIDAEWIFVVPGFVSITDV